MPFGHELMSTCRVCSRQDQLLSALADRFRADRIGGCQEITLIPSQARFTGNVPDL